MELGFPTEGRSIALFKPELPARGYPPAHQRSAGNRIRDEWDAIRRTFLHHTNSPLFDNFPRYPPLKSSSHLSQP